MNAVESIEQYTGDDKANTGMTHIVFAPATPGKKALCGYITKGVERDLGTADCVVCVSLNKGRTK